jgi:hypothetical protein
LLQVNITATGASVEEFEAGLESAWVGVMAELVSLPPDFVLIESVSPASPAPASRKLQAATDAIAVSTLIFTPDANYTAWVFQAALESGEVAETLASMKLTLTGASLEVSMGNRPLRACAGARRRPWHA